MADNKYAEVYKEVSDSIDIVETIRKYIKLEEKGSYFEGNCPFDEKCGVSFCVSSSKKSFYCFGCHARGDVVTFIAKIGNMNKTTAARFLSNLQKSSTWSNDGKEVSIQDEPAEKLF